MRLNKQKKFENKLYYNLLKMDSCERLGHFLLKKGSESKSTTTIEKLLQNLKVKHKQSSTLLMNYGIQKIKPKLTLKNVARQGRNLPIPTILTDSQQLVTAYRWYIEGAKKSKGITLSKKLTADMYQILRNDSQILKAKKDIYITAYKNKLEY